MQGAAPARFVEEVDDDVEDEADAVAHGGFVDLVFRGDEGPVDEKGGGLRCFPADETPVTAVEADGAVISHGEVMARRDDEVVALNVGLGDPRSIAL